MDERKLSVTAELLGLSQDELRQLSAGTTVGVAEALAGGLIRFEDALQELSRCVS